MSESDNTIKLMEDNFFPIPINDIALLLMSNHKTSKEIVSHLFGQDKKSFKQVVLVPFPREGIYTIGFLSEKAPPEINKATGHEMVSVFIPTTPNPTTGFTVIYNIKDIYYLKMKPEAAIKFVVSCGIVHPDEIEKTAEIITKEKRT